MHCNIMDVSELARENHRSFVLQWVVGEVQVAICVSWLPVRRQTCVWIHLVGGVTIDIRGRWSGNGCTIHVMVCINGLILYIWGFCVLCINMMI